MALERSWMPVLPPGTQEEEMQAMQREMLEASVLATVRSLRRQLRAQPADGSGGNLVLVASLDRSALNDASAALVAAAHHPALEWEAGLLQRVQDGAADDAAATDAANREGK